MERKGVKMQKDQEEDTEEEVDVEMWEGMKIINEVTEEEVKALEGGGRTDEMMICLRGGREEKYEM